MKDFVAALTGDRMGRGAYLSHLEAFIAASGGPFLVGASLTYADYCLFDLLNTMMRLLPDVLSTSPALTAWYAGMAGRPGIKAYVEGDAVHRKVANGNGLA